MRVVRQVHANGVAVSRTRSIFLSYSSTSHPRLFQACSLDVSGAAGERLAANLPDCPARARATAL